MKLHLTLLPLRLLLELEERMGKREAKK